MPGGSVRPLIVVTTTTRPGGDHQLPQVNLNLQYVAAVEDPGGTALLLTPGHDPGSVRQLVGMAHALVLTGGEDVDPARYGQEPHPELGTVNPPRDDVEFAALETALARRMPVLAICRGCQVLNVGMGGTLFQDLPSQRPGRVHHEQTAPWNHRTHHAAVQGGSGLHRIFGVDELFINSFHHQAVDALAPGLVATVVAEDGVVEGVEAPGYPWVYGVQWHPERGEARAARDQRDPDRRLFWALVQAAREFGETMGAPAERGEAMARG
jgi:putative glutamine amidotransferase